MIIKEKTELTAQKLFTTVVTAIRSYRDIRIIEQSRKGLKMIIAASPDGKDIDMRLLTIFADNVSEAFSNITLF